MYFYLRRLGDLNLPSIAALCGSMDSRASRYSASIRVQSGRTDIIADLGNMAKELLKTFYQSCGRKPERILFYRDGVSEGQFSQVLRGEVDALRGNIRKINPVLYIHFVFINCLLSYYINSRLRIS